MPEGTPVVKGGQNLVGIELTDLPNIQYCSPPAPPVPASLVMIYRTCTSLLNGKKKTLNFGLQDMLANRIMLLFALEDDKIIVTFSPIYYRFIT